jgi:hypothetical protein
MIRIVTAVVMVSLVGGCGGGIPMPFGKDRALRSGKIAFEGIRFRSDVDVLSEDRRDFTVSVRGASRNPVAAQQAAEFEAVKYCLGIAGGSDVDWTVDPYREADAIIIAADDTLNIAGRCTKR